MKGNDHTMLDPRRIEGLAEAMAEILRRKTPAERLAIGSKDVARVIGLVAPGMGRLAA